jgi:excisionase family DNA binding protein
MAPVTPAAPLSIADRLRSSDSALSVSELSKLLNVAPLTLLRWVKAKRVPFFRLGSTIRFCPATISRWLLARQSVPAWFTADSEAAA